MRLAGDLREALLILDLEYALDDGRARVAVHVAVRVAGDDARALDLELGALLVLLTGSRHVLIAFATEAPFNTIQTARVNCGLAGRPPGIAAEIVGNTRAEENM